MTDESAQKTVRIRTGSPEDLGRDFIDTWKKAECERVLETAQEEIIFLDIATLMRILSSKRLELPSELQKHPGINTCELAKRLDRHYKNVHSDVALLRNAGRIAEDEHKPGALFVPYSRIHAEINLSA